MVLFDKYIPTCQDTLRVRFKKITPMPEISHLMMLCQLLDCLLTADTAPPDSPKEVYEQYFVFALVWAFGSALYQDGVRQPLHALFNIWSNRHYCILLM